MSKVHSSKTNQAPQYTWQKGFHPIQHAKVKAHRRIAYVKQKANVVHNNVHNTNVKYKNLGKRDAQMQLGNQHQVYYDDKQVAQYAYHHMSTGKKIGVLFIIIILLLFILVGVVQ